MSYNRYDKDLEGNEKVQGTNYARDTNGMYFYPKDKNGNEFVVQEIGHIVGTDNRIKYPLSRSGMPIYPIVNGGQAYIKKDGVFHFGKNRAGMEVYAKDKYGNEFYPYDKLLFIIERNGRALYAKNKDGQTVFPIDKKGNEYYIEKIDPVKSDIPTRYAKNNDGCEVYPGLDGYTYYEFIIEDYAKDEKGQKYYPIDDYCNEFYYDTDTNGANRDTSVILLHRYALTWDFKVILLEINNNHFIDLNLMPKVTEDNILGQLKRKPTYYKDYLTNVKMDNGRGNLDFVTYYYRDKTTNNDVEVKKPIVKTISKSNMLWVILVVALVPLLIYGFFFYKSALSFSITTSV